MTRLPISDTIPELIAVLREHGKAVLQAPPGAGKTTQVPLAMVEANLTAGRVIMLEPRRIAARAAAQRMADTLGEPLGQTVGYRIRGERKVGKATRIEVVTEGILTRMIQSDPELGGVGALLFDEFHERSLNADLGLSLALECRAALRPDLILLAMSATLDTDPVAALMEAPQITSKGRMFPVETRWLDRSRRADARFDVDMAHLVRRALSEAEGSLLAFLPGEREIRNVLRQLSDLDDTDVLPLYGSLPFSEQQKALRPGPRRRVVLATAIAETSLTLPDIRIVVDGGLTRRSRFDPGSGLSRLMTEKVTRAEADQRRGRAGRVSDGLCYRLWTKGEEGALIAFPPPEIETADLTGLALELAEWGTDALAFLTPPPEGALAEARALLRSFGALDDTGRITPHGKALAPVPLHPRLAHMLLLAGASSAPLAALLAEGDPMRGAGVDLSSRLDALRSGDKRGTFSRIRREAARLAKFGGSEDILAPSEQAALAYPDRIALRRPGNAPRWLLSGGKGVKMDPGDPLAGSRLLVVTNTNGHPTEATVRTALPITESALRALFEARIETVKTAKWSKRDARVLATIEDRLGVIALSSRRWTDAPDEALAAARLDGLRATGLPTNPAVDRLRSRVALVRATGHPLPDMSDEVLLGTLKDWLSPFLKGIQTAADWRRFDLLSALDGMLSWEARQTLDREAPAKFTTPLGRAIPIDYSDDAPAIELRLQEMFGTTQHPTVAGRPLRVTLLSPAGRPLQTTMDVPGFWDTSYADVRKDMRGRYPKHAWPEDPRVADPTLRTKHKGG